MSDLLSSGSAILSPCGTYRYRLERDLGRTGPTGAFIMVNPSTADANDDDPTIKKVVGFAARLGWGRAVVGNLFAYRATDIRDLAAGGDVVGPDNQQHLACILAEVSMVIVAWGTVAKLPRHLRGQWRNLLRIRDAVTRGPLLCLGRTGDGHPLHPLMLGYDTPVTPWSPPRGVLTQDQVASVLLQMERVREDSYEASSPAAERRMDQQYGRLAKSIEAYTTGAVLPAEAVLS